jgi:hypothetical protein
MFDEGQNLLLCCISYRGSITYCQTRNTPTVLLQKLLTVKTLGGVILKANKCQENDSENKDSATRKISTI